MSLDLDYSKQRILQISSEAFGYMYFEEMPENGLVPAEVEDFNEEFELGFFITEYEYKNDVVQITVVPYIETDFSPQFYLKMFNGWVCECERSDKKIRYRHSHNVKGPDTIKETNIIVNEFGNECFVVGEYDEKFVSGHNSLYFLRSASRVNLM